MFSFIDQLPIYKNRRISNEPRWEDGDIGCDTPEVLPVEETSFQQSNTLKPFYMKLVREGLSVAYDDYKDKDPF